jgi:uncharacterized protein (TIGR02246 family)
MSERDEAAVRALLDRIYAAFAANDAKAYAAAYGEHAVALMPGGYLDGRAALETAMGQLFAGPLAGAKGVFEVQSIRFLRDDVAVVVNRGRVLLAAQSDATAADPWLDTWVLSRTGAAWQVESFHSCPEHA